MPKITKSKKKTQIKKEEKLIQCASCGNFKKKIDFFSSYTNKSGVTPYCKVCLKQMCNGVDNLPNLNKTLQVLKKIDRPYIGKLWDNVIKEEDPNAIGKYIRMLNMNQYRTLTWKDGEVNADNIMTKPMEDISPIETPLERLDNFSVDDEMMTMFGAGYTKEEYLRMYEKYNQLKKGYNLTTPMHKEALMAYVRVKVKEEMAIAVNNAADAKLWGDMAQKYAEKAKINPNQFSPKDLQGGVNSFSEVAQKIEETEDIIKILPSFKYRPVDAVDFCIWEYVNYLRNLAGMPEIEYKDVYEFYDNKKEIYLQQHGDPNGIFKDDPTEKNRENIKQFIKIAEDGDE